VGEDPVAAARLAVARQRTELERTAQDLRESLDVGARFRENPLPFIAVGAGLAFLALGGPGRVAGALRRTLFPINADKAYDSLPAPMQDWVDHMTRAVGPHAADAREGLARELAAWRADPRRNGKVSKQLAKQIAEGPPGPSRTAWSAAEVAASIVVAALARRAVERLLSGEPPPGHAKSDTLGTLGGAATARSEPPKGRRHALGA